MLPSAWRSKSSKAISVGRSLSMPAWASISSWFVFSFSTDFRLLGWGFVTKDCIFQEEDYIFKPKHCVYKPKDWMVSILHCRLWLVELEWRLWLTKLVKSPGDRWCYFSFIHQHNQRVLKLKSYPDAIHFFIFDAVICKGCLLEQ